MLYSNSAKNVLTSRSPQVSSALFFQYNTALVAPYQVLVDTNFLSHTVQKKLEMLPTMMDCLYAKCIPIITDCVMGELEKLGPKYRIALRIARDERWERLKCGHKGTYADDCIVDRVMRHKIYNRGNKRPRPQEKSAKGTGCAYHVCSQRQICH